VTIEGAVALGDQAKVAVLGISRKRTILKGTRKGGDKGKCS
jgi:hypothetical protein